MTDTAWRPICVLIGMALCAIGAGCTTAKETYAVPGTQQMRRSDAGSSIADGMTQSLAEHPHAANETPPKVLFAVPPSVPKSFYRDNESGSVTVRVYVSQMGSVSSVKVIQSTHDELSDAVISAMRQWRFEPMLRDGKPVPFQGQQTYKFQAK
jgi:TonB family protein